MLPSDSPPRDATASIADTCAHAMQLQLGGRVAEAERLYLEVLEANPKHAMANHCLGMLKVQSRRPLDGLPNLMAALEESPEIADYWLGYLEALVLAGRNDEALEALALGREHGLAGVEVEKFASRLTPDAEHIALPTRAARRRDERVAEKLESQILASVRLNRPTEALGLARNLTERFPQRGLGWKILGAYLWAKGAHEEALSATLVAARLLPGDAELLSNLGVTLLDVDRLDEAETALRAALEIAPTSEDPYFHLGNLHQMQGRYADAEASIRKAIALRSAQPKRGGNKLIHSSLLFMLSNNAALAPEALFAEHCKVGALLEGPHYASWPQHTNDRIAARRLRVGVVSADLYNHSVASFFEPVLASLGVYSTLELHAYYNNTRDDAVSVRLRGHFKSWNPIADLSDDLVAKKIMDDGIDILLDLSGHTTLNRLQVFARKPAPIQISWIGYPGTTGLRAMDYYLADRHFLPPGKFDAQFTEKIVRFEALAPFQPYEPAPAVNALPALETGNLCFGSFNRAGKINDASIALWARLLQELPLSRMMLAGIDSVSSRHSMIDRFMAHGIAKERLTLHSRCGIEEYLLLHNQVDIALDPTPYTGGTTTTHALWMGVPTLTIAGPTPAARQGASIQELVGIHGFSAENADDFVSKGVYWSAHLQALADLRAGLRTRWRQAPGRQPALIAAGLERAFRLMWGRWCAGLPTQSFEVAVPVLPS